MKKLIMAVVCGCSLIANAKDIDATINMKLVSDKIETNTYNKAISFYKKGLHEIDNWGSAAASYISYSTTNAIIHSFAYGYYVNTKCEKEHINDWPKTNITEIAIQRVRQWESTVTHGTQTVVSVYEKYDYPTKLITITSTTVIKYETTVTTNTLSLSLENEIIEVEKRR